MNIVEAIENEFGENEEHYIITHDAYAPLLQHESFRIILKQLLNIKRVIL